MASLPAFLPAHHFLVHHITSSFSPYLTLPNRLLQLVSLPIDSVQLVTKAQCGGVVGPGLAALEPAIMALDLEGWFSLKSDAYCFSSVMGPFWAVSTKGKF